MSPWLIKGLLAVAVVSSLTACGGDEENSVRADDRLQNEFPGFFEPGAPTTPTTPSSAAGLWFGVARPDADPNDQQPMLALVTEEGDFVAVAAYSSIDMYLFVGQNAGSGGNFDADPQTYYGGVDPEGEQSMIGTAEAGVSFSGSYTVGTSSAEFELGYSNLYQRSASLAKLQGVYTYDGFDGLHSVVVDSSGNLTGELYDGCTVTGTVTVPRPDRNYYRFTGTLGACDIFNGPMHGLIYLEDEAASGTTDNVIVMLGETDSHGTGIVMTGVK